MTAKAGLRPATSADCVPLTRLALDAKAYWGYTEAQMRRFEPAMTVTPQLIEDWQSGVLETVDDDLAGFYLLDGKALEAELMLLYVAPHQMGLGYGRRLFNAAADDARRCEANNLRIAADPHASGFYRRMGARQTGWCRAAWGAGDELPLYHLKL